MSMGWGSLITSSVDTVSNIYAGYQNAKHNKIMASIQNKTREILAGSALATTMNSALKKSGEITSQAKRLAMEVATSTIAAKGTATVEAATTGAMGKRVALAREQATSGAEDRKLALLQADTKAAQDALLDRMDLEYKQTLARIIASPEDVPASYSYSPISDILTGAGSIADSLLRSAAEDEDRKNNAING
jgi:hypothetical protein